MGEDLTKMHRPPGQLI